MISDETGEGKMTVHQILPGIMICFTDMHMEQCISEFELNSGQGHIPKSASVGEYRRATGMEALFGALALAGRTERVQELFRLGYGLDSADAAAREAAVKTEGEKNHG